ALEPQQGLLERREVHQGRPDRVLPHHCAVAVAVPEGPARGIDAVSRRRRVREYYRSIAPWLLPYLKDRPVVLTRFPDGIDGKSFYQKDAPEFAPDWIRTVPIWSNATQRDIRYFVCDDEDSLAYIANLGAIPLH